MSPTTHATSAKELTTLGARLALAGGQLNVEIGLDGRTRYLVELRGRVRTLDDIGQIEILADLIEGSNGPH
ncbi:hypothetical protein ACSFA7_22615 [Variovorax sp. LT1R20]|uniref:hypothetical protein n=1 Tax=Variovorax sp. LT1R20 TaxID=3443729 RepID=UPI003F489FB8